MLTKPTETAAQRREIQRLTDQTQESYSFLATQIANANRRIVKKMNAIWEMGGSLQSPASLLTENKEPLLTFQAYFNALQVEHSLIEEEISETFPERKYSACKFFRYIFCNNLILNINRLNNIILKICF